jgi:hypothetical protein
VAYRILEVLLVEDQRLPLAVAARYEISLDERVFEPPRTKPKALERMRTIFFMRNGTDPRG